jgi:hypothetical protein
MAPLGAFLFVSASLFAQTYSLSPVPKMQFLDATGAPLAGGLVYTYTAGTTTNLVTYQDSLGTPNTDPVVLDSGGYANIWLPVRTAYKFCVNDANNVQLYCVDNIENTQIGSVTDIIALFSGVCNFTTWLRGDGICATPAGGGNVSAVGLTENYVPIASGATSLINGPLQIVPDSGPTLSFMTLGGTSRGVLDAYDNINGQIGGLTVRLTAGESITAKRLYKINTAGNAVSATTSDTTTTVYIARQEYSGFAQLYIFGAAPCDFDGSPTAGDVVVASVTDAGKCHDIGSTVRPFDLYTLGVVQGGIVSSTANVLLSPSFSPSNGAGNVGTVASRSIRSRSPRIHSGASGTATSQTYSFPGSTTFTRFPTAIILASGYGFSSGGGVYAFSAANASVGGTDTVLLAKLINATPDLKPQSQQPPATPTFQCGLCRRAAAQRITPNWLRLGARIAASIPPRPCAGIMW